jgi:hypothetical protein
VVRLVTSLSMTMGGYGLNLSPPCHRQTVTGLLGGHVVVVPSTVAVKRGMGWPGPL